MEHSLSEILEMGGGAMWVILAFSVIVLAVFFDRLLAHWGFLARARELHKKISSSLQRDAIDEARSACERSQSPMADVFLTGFERHGRVKAKAVAAAVQRDRLRVIGDLKSRTWVLGTIGATAPFVGLFGTVIGIISGLAAISKEKSNDLSVVSGPLSEALYATAAGILVAVEAVIVFNYFNQRLGKVAIEARLMTEEFLELLEDVEPSARSRSKAASKRRADSDADDDEDED
jgi:biopolymer transport protein ExbB